MRLQQAKIYQNAMRLHQIEVTELFSKIQLILSQKHIFHAHFELLI